MLRVNLKCLMDLKDETVAGKILYSAAATVQLDTGKQTELTTKI